MNPKVNAATNISTLSLSLFAMTADAADIPVEAQLPPPAIMERTANQRTWQTVRPVQVDEGTVLKTNVYYEIGTGICFDPNGNGQYVDSKEVINVINGYGIANQGVHQAIFSPSITDSPAVDYSDPSGNRFQSRLLGLAYFDYASGRSAMICVTKQSIGTVQNNVVTYSDAFSDGISADVTYEWKFGSFEQNVVVRKNLPSPSLYSLDPTTTRIQVWNEMLVAPEPVLRKTTYIYQESDPAILQAYAEPDFKDEFLSWGSMHMSRGKCFAIESDAIAQAGIDVGREVPVGKEWTQAADPDTGNIRVFLVESVEFGTVKPLLDTLEAALGNAQDQNKSLAGTKTRPAVGRREFLAALPKPPKKARSTASLQTASVVSLK